MYFQINYNLEGMEKFHSSTLINVSINLYCAFGLLCIPYNQSKPTNVQDRHCWLVALQDYFSSKCFLKINFFIISDSKDP